MHAGVAAILQAVEQAQSQQRGLETQLEQLQASMKAQEVKHKRDMAKVNVLAEVALWEGVCYCNGHSCNHGCQGMTTQTETDFEQAREEAARYKGARSRNMM